MTVFALFCALLRALTGADGEILLAPDARRRADFFWCVPGSEHLQSETNGIAGRRCKLPEELAGDFFECTEHESMSRLPQNEFEGAQRILWRYYERVVREMAEDIIKNTEDFEQPFGNADSILEKHYCRLSRIGCTYAYLRSLASKDKPKGTQPLAKNEFRCFGCGGVIKEDDNSCRLCGWTWR